MKKIFAFRKLSSFFDKEVDRQAETSA